ncbi:hypothetical protein GHT09_009253 [Marmota monax]|uniref:Septin-type G domain-containing protein n=1 Tax=Marmota monax TaxID=9995 RepID=A0A834ULN2_MARMO|nr:hypothetical protein GHT09_009253 [Marmota monax]
MNEWLREPREGQRGKMGPGWGTGLSQCPLEPRSGPCLAVENMAHCEFPLLRDLLIRSHLQDLKDITHNVHYENYRVIRLNESHLLPSGPGWVNLGPASTQQLTTTAPLKVRRRVQEDPKDEF